MVPAAKGSGGLQESRSRACRTRITLGGQKPLVHPGIIREE